MLKQCHYIDKGTRNAVYEILRLQHDCCYFPLLPCSPHTARTRACVLSVMTTTVPLAQCAQLNRP